MQSLGFFGICLCKKLISLDHKKFCSLVLFIEQKVGENPFFKYLNYVKYATDAAHMFESLTQLHQTAFVLSQSLCIFR